MSNTVPPGTHLPGDAEVSTLIRNGRSYTVQRLIERIQDSSYGIGAALATLFSAKPVATGTAVLAAGAVTVANSSVTANSIIRVAQATPGANAGAPFVSSIVPGTGFTIKSTNGSDTSTVRYVVDTY